MNGRQPLHIRLRNLAAGLLVSFLTIAGEARAQYPSPTVPQAGMPAVSVHGMTAPQVMPAPTIIHAPTYYSDFGVGHDACPVKMGVFETITESLFGDAAHGGRSRSAPSSARAGASPGPVVPPGNPA